MYRRHLLGLALGAWALSGPSLARATQIRNARLWTGEGKTRLVLDLTGPVPFQTFRLSSPERLIIDLPNSQLVTGLNNLMLDGSPIRVIRSAPHGLNDTRIVLELLEPVDAQSFLLPSEAAEGQRLVLDLQTKALEVAKKASPSITPPQSDVASSSNKGNRDIVIVIDPGHGGKDPGAVGAKGEREKDVVLAIARNLQRRINQQKGFKAKLVRNDDIFIPLRKRVDFAHQQNADMFVSVHADAAPRLTASGASVFALSATGATSSMARWIAASENGVDLLGGRNSLPLKGKDPQLAGVILDMSVNSTIASSLDLGHSVLGSLNRITNLHQKRVEQAGFAVLKSPDIPSILIETGFISNREDSRRLLDTRHQQAIANSIFDGVHSYFTQRPPMGTYLSSLKNQNLS